MQRESFRSRLGFLLVSAGCAIGIGNVWRFPYVAGQYGGGLFVLIYLICLLVMGVPVLTMELAVGRASKKSAVLAYKALEPKGSKWHIHGWFCLLGCVMLMMYYTTVTGWMVSYFGKFLIGTFHAGMSTEEASGVFGTMLSQPGKMAFWTEFVVIAGFLVCSFGLQNGLERVSKIMMLALLGLILILAVHSLTLSGAAEGMKFYLLPSAKSIEQYGLGTIITGAMNQAFFTLSLGIAAMEIFGSYTPQRPTPCPARPCASARSTPSSPSWQVRSSSLPASPSALRPIKGPSLIFQTLPNVFVNMAGGRVWGALFFLFMIFASFSTVLAVFENIHCHLHGHLRLEPEKGNAHWRRSASRSESSVRVWLRISGRMSTSSAHAIFWTARTSSSANLLLPIGSLVYLLFCVSKWGWGFDKYLAEANRRSGTQVLPEAEGLLPVDPPHSDPHHSHSRFTLIGWTYKRPRLCCGRFRCAERKQKSCKPLKTKVCSECFWRPREDLNLRPHA